MAWASNGDPMFVRKKRAAPARKGKAASKRAKKAKPKAGPRFSLGLEQRHLDLIGLGLLAAGVYLVFVLFAGWEGGKVGYGLQQALDYLVGSVGAKIITLLLLLAGGMLLTGTSVATRWSAASPAACTPSGTRSSSAAPRRRARSVAPTTSGASGARRPTPGRTTRARPT